MTDNVRRQNCIYGENDLPPVTSLFFLALQYFATCATFLLLVVIVFGKNASAELKLNAISIAMLLCGASAIFQSLKSRFLGAGLFAPATPNPAYLAASIVAVKQGGVGLLAGMTLFASIMQMIFTQLMESIKKFFPPELGILVITMIGFELGEMGISRLTHLPLGQTETLSKLAIALFSFCLMCGLYIFAKNGLKTFALLIGIATSYILMFVFHLIDSDSIKAISEASWFFMPSLPKLHYQFSTSLIVPFTIAALVCTTKVTGSITALQQTQFANLDKPDMAQIKRGGMADALTNVLAGLTGNLGLNISSSAMALSVSTGICSRYIAYPYCALFFIMAFCPKVACIFIYIPQVVISATLVFLGVTLITTSLKILTPMMNTPKRQYIVGLSFMLALSYDIYPSYYHHLPATFKQFTGSPIALATVFALILNFLFMLKLDDPDHIKYS